jgi:hypothetical protein
LGRRGRSSFLLGLTQVPLELGHGSLGAIEVRALVGDEARDGIATGTLFGKLRLGAVKLTSPPQEAARGHRSTSGHRSGRSSDLAAQGHDLPGR